MGVNGVFNLTENVAEFYSYLIAPIPDNYKILVNLFIITMLIFLYAIFIWKFYRFLAKRDIIKLNLNQYNRSKHVFWSKFFASLFFIAEYIVIIPLIIFFWFGILAIFFLLLAKNIPVEQILLISAAVIAATRLTAYYKEDLSRDLAKLFPFTVLVIFLLEPNFFKLNTLMNRFLEIPLLLNHIFMFLIFIVILELVLRAIQLVFLFFKSADKYE